MVIFKKLCPTKKKDNKKAIIGFDIETYDDNKGFLCCSFYGDGWTRTCYSKREAIDFMVQERDRFTNAYVVASNLSFDFFGLFYGEPEVKEFMPLFKGSDLVCASSFIEDGGFRRRPLLVEGEDGKMKRRFSHQAKVSFIDTMNYAKISVDSLGKIINLPKLHKPDFLGKFPQNQAEWDEMVEYNMRDSEVSKMFIDFLFNAFQDLGSSPKMTIASSSMSLFKNIYLDREFYVHPKEILLDIFKGYYGGHTEAFCRGGFGEGIDEEEWNYYDLNSLYPSCMRQELPDPNTFRVTYRDTLEYIRTYEGMSDVDLICPYMKYPFLPMRGESKLLFPYGEWRGSYCHVELRKALELGYKIKKVHKTIYYTKTIPIFRRYAEDLYAKRLLYKAEGSAMEFVVKIMLNSLYGKFAEAIDNRDNWLPDNLTIEEIQKFDEFERVNGFFRVVVKNGEPHAHSFPIWSAYITAHARMTLHDAIVKYEPIYVDTDSIMTTKKVAVGSGLGEWKKEMTIKKGIIVRPKFYAIIDKFPKDAKKEEIVKIKGLGTQLSFLSFIGLAGAKDYRDRRIKYNKYTKFKEAVRHNFIPNEIREVFKTFNVNDEKRDWFEPFNIHKLVGSDPLKVSGGVIVDKRLLSQEKLTLWKRAI